MDFNTFKIDEQGLIPVVTQDFLTKKVLMVAYMNKEAFDKTLETGKATYYSRSRKSLWLKGETSGHYQHVKSIKIDCDKDTLLLEVKQEGAACHTGSETCFFETVKEFEDSKDGLEIFNDVYNVIVDRRDNPKEGSYTNYLFDKGIDKMLKKVGEETAEVIIGAKNEGIEEVTYEISDLMYHLMVLMVEKGVEWDDIVKELSKRK